MISANNPCLTVLLTVWIAAGGCSHSTIDAEPEDSSAFPELQGPYLGQTPPGLTPVRFGPPELHANSAWHWHGAPSFSRTGLEMYFVEYHQAGEDMQIWYTSGATGTWTTPERAAFATGMEANQPTLVDDDAALLFAANQSVYRVERAGSSWSNQTRVALPLSDSQQMGWEFSLAADGDLYLLIWVGGRPGIYRSALVSGAYEAPVSVGGSVNTDARVISPLVAPDESWLIFSAERPAGYGVHDLWISFRNDDGGWSEPINMGPGINSAAEEVTPALSPDGKYLFFGTQRSGDLGDNPYWVSAAVIDSIRVRAGR
jgi:hypothetical protein